jgi:hypothetical protein
MNGDGRRDGRVWREDQQRVTSQQFEHSLHPSMTQEKIITN